MIVTLTANPSHDRTVNLAGPLERGAVQRAESVISQAGGKGVNISRACVAADLPSIAVLPAVKDDPFVLELLAAGIDCRPVDHEGDLRVNITITEPDGTTTKLNSPGPQATPDCSTRSRRHWYAAPQTADWIVLAGSLPPGAPPEWYAELVTALRSAGARVAVDTSDAPLKALVDALPTSAPASDEAQRRGARVVHRPRRRGARGRPGRRPPRRHDLVEARRRVGAGDARPPWRGAGRQRRCLARDSPADHGRLDRRRRRLQPLRLPLGDVTGRDPDHRLALAVAYGSAAAGLPGTTIPHPEQVRPDRVHVTRLDLPEES